MSEGYTSILVERPAEGVALVRLNRPESLNALNATIMEELLDALEEFDEGEDIRCVVLTGGDRAFAAGADITDMAGAGPVDMYLADTLSLWDGVSAVRTPIIAAVSGWCLGGGCELAMACDVIIASETAKFGQPEISIGVIPGAGGTQRLTKVIGKSRAMEMVLTGEPMGAEEAARRGLVSRVVPQEALLDEAVALASKIASQPPIAVRLGKDAVNRSYETLLGAGLAAERHNFYLLFATEDQREGMDAFVNKRKPQWKGR
ncbi:MAG TPA: enoyl-CoA hydratase-related protein [Actinomycetota bacterium]|nr:enoyl-CoA hydratase-related protein [Actinomycetota bacterium]